MVSISSCFGLVTRHGDTVMAGKFFGPSEDSSFPGGFHAPPRSRMATYPAWYMNKNSGDFRPADTVPLRTGKPVIIDAIVRDSFPDALYHVTLKGFVLRLNGECWVELPAKGVRYHSKLDGARVSLASHRPVGVIDRAVPCKRMGYQDRWYLLISPISE